MELCPPINLVVEAIEKRTVGSPLTMVPHFTTFLLITFFLFETI